MYRYTAGKTGLVSVTVNPQPGFDPAPAVFGTCAPAGCLLARNDNGGGVPEKLFLEVTQGTTYFVVIDSPTPSFAFPAGRGGFTVSVDESPL